LYNKVKSLLNKKKSSLILLLKLSMSTPSPSITSADDNDYKCKPTDCKCSKIVRQRISIFKMDKWAYKNNYAYEQ